MTIFTYHDITYYQDSSLPDRLPYPILPTNSWSNATQRLLEILHSHGEEPALGSRFLVGRLRRQAPCEGASPQTVFYDYILRTAEGGYERVVDVYVNQPLCSYDFDVFELHPVCESLGVAYL